MFGLMNLLNQAGGLEGLTKQVEDFKSQFERLVSAVEKTQRDVELIKNHLGIVPPELTEAQKEMQRQNVLLQNCASPYQALRGQ